jgi:hypothetical protein
MSDMEATPPAPPPAPPPGYRIYSPGGVVWATVFGGVAAGGTVMALNYWRWRRPREAWYALLGGILGMIALLGLAQFAPEQIPSAAYVVPQFFVIHMIAKQHQGSLYESHVAQGGRKASNWKAVGIGAIWLTLILGGLVGWLLVNLGEEFPFVEIRPHQRIFFVEGASQEKAQALAEAFKKSAYLDESSTMDMVLSGSGNDTAIGFVVADGVWDREPTVKQYCEVVEEVAPSVGGKPITLRLLNTGLEEKKRIRLEK